MSLMPTIDDRMVVQFRRTGKRCGSYRPARGGRVVAAAQHVVLQRSPGCKFHGQLCVGSHGQVGECDENLICMVNPFPGPDPFRLPRF
jgi:hypothetical protein